MTRRWITALGLTALAGASFLLAGSARADVGDYAYYTNTYGDISWGYNAAKMPDIDQRRGTLGGVIGLPNNGKMYCVPTSCMDLLSYISTHGYSSVWPGITDWQSTSTSVFNQMSVNLTVFGSLMGTDPFKGTGGNGARNATKLFLDASKFGIDLIYADKSYCPLFSDLALMAIQGRLVSVGVGWYSDADDPSLPHYRRGGHQVTLGYANSPGLFTPAQMGVMDPNNDKQLYTQSTYALDTYDIEEVSAKFGYTNNNGVDKGPWKRTQSRVKGLGSGYIDGALVIKPKQGLISQGSAIWLLSPINVFNQERALPQRSFKSMTGGSVNDIAYDPLDTKIPYLIEGQDSLFELDLLTGESRVLPAVQRTESGLPTFVKPQRLLIGGPERKLFVLQPTQLTCLSRTGEDAKVVPLRSPLAAVAFSEKTGLLYGFDRATGELLQFDQDLNLVRADRLGIALATPYRLELASNPLTGGLTLLCDGSVDIWQIAFGDSVVPQVKKVTLQGARVPVGIDLDEAGMLIANDMGRIVSFDPNTGRPSYTSPFVGLPGGTNQRIVRSFSNYNPAVHVGPSFDNVLPPSVEDR